MNHRQHTRISEKFFDIEKRNRIYALLKITSEDDDKVEITDQDTRCITVHYSYSSRDDKSPINDRVKHVRGIVICTEGEMSLAAWTYPYTPVYTLSNCPVNISTLSLPSKTLEKKEAKPYIPRPRKPGRKGRYPSMRGRISSSGNEATEKKPKKEEKTADEDFIKDDSPVPSPSPSDSSPGENGPELILSRKEPSKDEEKKKKKEKSSSKSDLLEEEKEEKESSLSRSGKDKEKAKEEEKEEEDRNERISASIAHEGTILRLYTVKEYMYLSTYRVLDADVRWSGLSTFKKTFIDIWGDKYIPSEGRCYAFLLRDPDSKIAYPSEKPELFLVGIFEGDRHLEVTEENIPEYTEEFRKCTTINYKLPLETLRECKAYLEANRWLDAPQLLIKYEEPEKERKAVAKKKKEVPESDESKKGKAEEGREKGNEKEERKSPIFIKLQHPEYHRRLEIRGEDIPNVYVRYWMLEGNQRNELLELFPELRNYKREADRKLSKLKSLYEAKIVKKGKFKVPPGIYEFLRDVEGKPGKTIEEKINATCRDYSRDRVKADGLLFLINNVNIKEDNRSKNIGYKHD